MFLASKARLQLLGRRECAHPGSTAAPLCFGTCSQAGIFFPAPLLCQDGVYFPSYIFLGFLVR